MMPTATASDHIERNSTSSEKLNPLTGKSVSLDRFVKFWPDAETQASGKPQMWPTPTAHLHKEGGYPAEYTRNTPTLTAEATQSEGKPHSSGSLNPTWVEWLMGFPEGWTDLKPSEMPSSRKSSRKSAKRLSRKSKGNGKD
tara:strand:- start:515 stop:937 length:423 start_codon:yes stop_codon:yes gene_type:complete